jgi:hypothetical protein
VSALCLHCKSRGKPGIMCTGHILKLIKTIHLIFSVDVPYLGEMGVTIQIKSVEHDLRLRTQTIIVVNRRHLTNSNF